MTEETKPNKGRIKSWMDRNNIDSADVISVGILAALVGGMCYLIYKSEQAINEENDKINNWSDEQKSLGREIIEDNYGRLLAVDSYTVY